MKKIIVLVALVVYTTPAQAHPMKHPAKELYFAHRCDHGNVFACIHRGAIHWGASYADLRQLSGCETGRTWRTDLTNPSGAAGLFQFMPGTWRSTPYASHSVYSAKWASFAGAWGRTHGVTWSC